VLLSFIKITSTLSSLAVGPSVNSNKLSSNLQFPKVTLAILLF